jgi:hypothetical protein
MNYWINDFRNELLATIEGLGLPADQRQRGASCSPAKTTCAAPRPRFWNGPAHAGGEARRIWRRALSRGCHFMAPGYLLEEVFDPTGAGDCFAGGFMGYLAGRGIKPLDGAEIDVAELRAP